MNILVTSAGQRVSLVRAFQRELKRMYPLGKVLTVDMNPELSPACIISDGYFKIKKISDPFYISDLLDYCRLNEIKLVIPTIDTELQLLADNRELFDSYNIHVIISSGSFVEKCHDKRKTNDFFKEHSLDYPALIDKDNPVFPLFVKPYDGSSSENTYIIKKAEDMNTRFLEDKKLLFMEYIDKTFHDEFTVDMYYGKDNHVKCIVPRKRIKVRAGEVNKGLTCKNNIVSYLKKNLNFIEGAIGCLTTQVFLNRNNSSIIAIEINPRFGGGYPLSYFAGANFPLWLIEEYCHQKEISYMEDWEDNLLMLRYDDEVLVHDFKA